MTFGPRKSFVYFAKGEKSGLIKIGYSTDPDKRCSTFKNKFDQSEGASVIFAILGTYKDESQFHRQFAEHHSHGEWFRKEGELADFIEKGRVTYKKWRPAPHPPTQITVTLPILSVGFCVDIAGEEKLRKAGLSKIWRRGNGAESLEDAIAEFRGRPGALVVSDDLRIFGLTQKEIFARCSALADMEIRVANVNHPGENIHDLQKRAFGALHAAAPIRNRRIARRRGSLGGLAKSANAEAGRATRIAPDIARKLCASRLTCKEKAEILDMPISTVQRHYGTRKTKT